MHVKNPKYLGRIHCSTQKCRYSISYQKIQMKYRKLLNIIRIQHSVAQLQETKECYGVYCRFECYAGDLFEY